MFIFIFFEDLTFMPLLCCGPQTNKVILFANLWTWIRWYTRIKYDVFCHLCFNFENSVCHDCAAAHISIRSTTFLTFVLSSGHMHCRHLGLCIAVTTCGWRYLRYSFSPYSLIYCGDYCLYNLDTWHVWKYLTFHKFCD